MSNSSLSSEQIAVLKQLYDGVIRPANTMALRLGLKLDDVEAALKSLEESDLVEQRKVSKWRITYDGKIALDSSQKQTVTGQLKWICWGLATLCAALGVVDFVWEQEKILNPSRMAIVGVVVALVILPFAQRLKLLGVEFERTGDKSVKQNENG